MVDGSVESSGHRPKTPESRHLTPRETSTAAQVRSSMTVPPDLVVGLLGSADENLRALETGLSADVHVRGNAVNLAGSAADVALAERVVSELIAIVAGGQALSPDSVRRSVAMVSGEDNASPAEVLTLDILSRRGKHRSAQDAEPEALRRRHRRPHRGVRHRPRGNRQDLPRDGQSRSGTADQTSHRIILTRPAVEAGERLGFLPGTLSEKIDPYLRPLYDALHDMMDPEAIPKLMAAGVIEVAPLAYMRGRAQPRSTKVLTPKGFRAIGARYRRSCYWLRRAPDLGTRGSPTGLQGDLSRIHAGRFIHSRIWRPFVGGVYARRSSPRKARASLADQRDDRQPPRCALPSLRAASAFSAS